MLDTAREALASAEQQRADAAAAPTRPAALGRRARGRDPRAGEPRAGGGGGRSARPSRRAGRPDHRTGGGTGRRPARRHRARGTGATGCSPAPSCPRRGCPRARRRCCGLVGAPALLEPRLARIGLVEAERGGGPPVAAAARATGWSAATAGCGAGTASSGPRRRGPRRRPGAPSAAPARGPRGAGGARPGPRRGRSERQCVRAGGAGRTGSAGRGRSALAGGGYGAAAGAPARRRRRWPWPSAGPPSWRSSTRRPLPWRGTWPSWSASGWSSWPPASRATKRRPPRPKKPRPGSRWARPSGGSRLPRPRWVGPRLHGSPPQRDVRVLGEAAERSTVELEQARLVAGADARAAAEQEAERRARAGALERELAELARRWPRPSRRRRPRARWPGTRETEQMAAEAALATAEAARRQAAEALTAARAEAAALARRLEGVEREPSRGRARRVEAEAVLAELRQRLQRLEGELGAGAGEPAIRSGGAGGTRGPAGSRRKRRQRRRAPSWLAGRPSAQGLEAELAAADAALAGLRERLAVAQSERGHAHEALAATVAAVRDRLQQEPLSHARGRGDPGRGGGGQHRRARAPARAAAGVARPAGAGQSAGRGRGRRARGRPSAETRAREAELQQAVDRLRAGIAHARPRGAASGCWPRSRRSTAISAACSPCCSAAARRICG